MDAKTKRKAVAVGGGICWAAGDEDRQTLACNMGEGASPAARDDPPKAEGSPEAAPRQGITTQLTGWLNLRISNRLVSRKAFKPRWFVFSEKNCKLYHFRDPRDMVSGGEINIYRASFSYDASCRDRPGLFEIRSDGKIWELEAEGRKSMMKWLHELQGSRRMYSESKLTISQKHSQESNQDEKHADEAADSCQPKSPENKTSNWSLAALRSEIMNIISNRKPQTSLTGVSKEEEWTFVDSDEVKQSLCSEPSTAVKSSKWPKATFKAFTGKSPESAAGSSAQTQLRNNICDKCRQLECDGIISKDDMKIVEEKLHDNQAVINLLQKEINQLQQEMSTKNLFAKEDKSDVRKMLTEKDRHIIDVEYLLKLTNDEKTELGSIKSKLEKECAELHQQISVYQETLKDKDNTIIQLTNQLQEETQDLSSWSVDAAVQGRQCNVIVEDLPQIEKLADICSAYELQNKFLTLEILELNELRKHSDEREKAWMICKANLEAKYYQVKSKYLFLLQQLEEPCNAGNESVKQLLKEALDSESQINSQEFLSSLAQEHDQYGFIKSISEGDRDLSARAAALQKMSDELSVKIKETDENASHRVKWDNYMMLLGNREVVCSPELKTLIRSGIPHEHKERIWSGCVSIFISKQKQIPGYYKHLIAKAFMNKQNPAAKQIELDLLRTLPNNKHYISIDSEGIQKLRRVLLAYSWHNPLIGYCQGLNRLAAVALLFLSEEDAFWCLVCIVEYLLPQDYYSHTMCAAQTDQRVLKDLVQDKLHRLHVHLEQYGVDVSLFTFNWFLTVFVDNVPPETFLRIWDAFLYEGSKVLFRFALAFFKYAEEDLLQQKSYMAINRYLQVLGGKMTDCKRIAQIAFNDVNPFPLRNITSRRQQHLQQVKLELAELDRMRKDYHSGNPSDKLEWNTEEQ